MKKIFILYTCLMSAFQTFAQINLKDSTALVIAYWCKGEKYTNAIQIASPFESGKNLDGELTRYVAEYNPETSWTTFHSITSYNKEQLKMAVFNYLNSIAPQGQKIAISEIPQISMDGYTSITVHLDTGWPGYASLLQETAHPDKTRLKRWYIEIEL